MNDIRIAMYQPDIPQNVGAMMRLCACVGAPLDIIEPCGFPWDPRKIKQAGMDYMTKINYARYSSWQNFIETKQEGRIILMTTRAQTSYLEFKFQAGDTLLAGRESAGVPDDVHAQVNDAIMIPMHGDARSLNIVNATSMITGEALRQTGGFKL